MHAWPESGRRPGAEARRDQGPHLSRPPPTVVSAAHLSISRGTQHALLAEGPADAFVSGGSFPWPCVWCGDGGTSRCWCATRRAVEERASLWRRARPAGFPGCSGRLAGQFPPRLSRDQSQRPAVCGPEPHAVDRYLTLRNRECPSFQDAPLLSIVRRAACAQLA
jgi:hypothetical protein